ncbi:MAG: right-handed parallel beta-helix repeat-containing protein [Gemmatimonadetes bacterium]|nr:right-handed parallel beta-helix repeat-containing protein [Gemmatimonadota bacterium]
MRTQFIVLSFVLGACGNASGAVWNISPDGTGDAPTIQAAVDLASPGDEIRLAPGTYYDAVTRTIQGHSAPRTTTAVAFTSVQVHLTSVGGADVTFIDGENSHHGLMIVDGGDATVSGITFRNCARSGGEIWGGGIMVHRSSPTIEDCAFVDCEGWAGGGVFISQGSGAVIRRNKFVNNHGGDLAGGLELFQTSGAIVEHNTFVGNTATRFGGGLLVNDSSASLSANIFANNTAGEWGGGLACWANTTLAADCDLYWNNSAPEDPDFSVACALEFGIDGLVYADPLFCDPSNGNYLISSQSPAAPEHSGICGLRGACPVGCGPVSVEASSWGQVKVWYR